MVRELCIIAGGLVAWIGLVELRISDSPRDVQEANDKLLRSRRWISYLISVLGLCLALYGAW